MPLTGLKCKQKAVYKYQAPVLGTLLGAEEQQQQQQQQMNEVNFMIFKVHNLAGRQYRGKLSKKKKLIKGFKN